MQFPLVLAVCLLAPCAGLPTSGFLAKQKGGTPLGASSVASLRLRTEVASYAQALGRLLDMAGIPMALRVPAARTIINRDADRLEQLHGRTVGAEAFRRRMPHLVPDSMMYYSSPRQDPLRGADAHQHGQEKVFTSSRVTTEGSEIMKDGQGRFTVRTTTCVNGECTRSNKTVDRTGAGHITPKAPLATIGRLMAGMSGVARRLAEEMEDAGSDLSGIVGGGMPEGGEDTPSTDDEVAPSEDDQAPMADSLDPFRAMEAVMGHSPLGPLAASFDPFKEMMNSTGFGPRRRREEPRPSRAARMPLSARFDPFEGLEMPGFGEDFPHFGDFFGEPSEEPSGEPPEERPFQDLIHRIFQDVSGGDASGGASGDASGNLGDVSEHQERSSTVTRIENGHAVQEIKKCKNGECVTERHEYDVPADQLGGSPAVPLA